MDPRHEDNNTEPRTRLAIKLLWYRPWIAPRHLSWSKMGVRTQYCGGKQRRLGPPTPSIADSIDVGPGIVGPSELAPDQIWGANLHVFNFCRANASNRVCQDAPTWGYTRTLLVEHTKNCIRYDSRCQRCCLPWTAWRLKRRRWRQS